MATVSKASLKVVGGGEFNRVAGGGGLVSNEFTTASNQYAIVSLTNMWMVGTGGASSMNITSAGVQLARIQVSGSFAGSVVKTDIDASAANASVVGAPFILYIGPGKTFTTTIGASGGAGTNLISGSYTIYENS